MRLRTAIAALLAAGLVQGCASCDHVPSGAVTSCEQTPPVPTAVKTDILFVIDDSGSMRDEQLRLRNALVKFIETLDASPVANDFQIGVTTTAVKTYGGSLTYPSTRPSTDPYDGIYPVPYPAGTPFPGGILTAIDPASVDPFKDPPDFWLWGDFLWDSTQGFYGARMLSSGSASLVTDFSRNVLVGTLGSGREEPFAAMDAALTAHAQAGGKNEGFLRDGAKLAVVFLSDEDDCSGTAAGVSSDGDCDTERVKAPGSSLLTPIQDYVDLLQTTLAARDPVVAAVVGARCVGGVCDTTNLCGTAYRTPYRYRQLLDALAVSAPNRQILSSICDDNFDATLTDIACMLVPQDVPLDSEPADWGMMAVGLKSGGATTACHIVMAGDPAENDPETDVVIHEAAGGQPAFLHFQNACRLGCGKQIEISLICAG